MFGNVCVFITKRKTESKYTKIITVVFGDHKDKLWDFSFVLVPIKILTVNIYNQENLF